MPVGVSQRTWVESHYHGLQGWDDYTTGTFVGATFVLDIVMHTDPHPGGGEDGAEKQGVLLPHLCICRKNEYAFLNHIIIGHYWSSFSCGKCLEFAVSSGQQMKKHFPKFHSPKEACKKVHSKGGKSSWLQGNHKSSHKPKKGKKDKIDKDDRHGMEDDKPCGSPSKSGGKATSQEQVPGTPCCSRCLAGSTSGGGHHKKSKKHGKKKLHKKSHYDTSMDTEAFEDVS